MQPQAVAEVLIKSAAHTTEQAVEREGGQWTGGHFLIDLTVDGGGSLTPHLEAYNPANASWETILSGAAITSTGKVTLAVAPYKTAATNLAAERRLPHRWRFRMAVGDTSEMTYSVCAWLDPE